MEKCWNITNNVEGVIEKLILKKVLSNFLAIYDVHLKKIATYN